MSDATLVYLQALEPVLGAVMAAHPDALLRVCSTGLPALPTLPRDRVELVPWSEQRELEAVASFDVAVSPLASDPWSQARGGRVSVLLSLAAGVPVIAAPGGGLEELIGHAGQPEPGLVFARDGSEWVDHLARLLTNRDERVRRSAAARELIDQQIWADVQYPRFKRAVLG